MLVKKPTERLDFQSFLKGEEVIINANEIALYERKKAIYKTTIKIGTVATLTILTTSALTPTTALAAKTLSEVAVQEEGGAFDNLIDGLLGILDPAAKIFGMIAGLAIMTGNGKIGLERLFWLSLGYITSRKVETWIDWLNTI